MNKAICLWDNIMQSNICIVVGTEEEERERVGQKIMEETMTTNF